MTGAADRARPGTVALLALAPWVPGLGSWALPLAALLAAGLVAAPLRDSPARDRAEVFIDPLRPEALGLTTTALWATSATLVLGLPVGLVSLVVLALT